MAQRLEIGLLWYDGDAKRELTSKVEEAVACYKRKFGQQPNTCYVHQGSLEREIDWRGVRIVGAPNVLPNHFWVGVAEATRRPAQEPAA
jgi:hypothetical protein